MSGIAGVTLAAARSLGLDEAETAAIDTALGLIHVLQVYTSCMVAVAVWDWLTSLNAEWDTIWKREWSLIKCLYIWTRYYGLFSFCLNLWLFNGNFTVDQCKTLHYLIAATCMWTTLGSEAILAVRTYAFLGKKLWLGIVLGVMLAGETAYLLYVSIAGVWQIPPPPFPELDGVVRAPCTASDKPGQHIVSGFWLAPVVFALVCTGLTAIKAFQLQSSSIRSPIIKTFVTEGLVYFLAVCGVNLINAAFMFQSNPNLQNVNCFLALVLSQVLCCRLVLNLRRQGEQTSHIGTAGSHSGQHSFLPGGAHRSQGVSIALRKYRETGPSDVNPYDGVKVQIDVERHDSSSGHNGKHMGV